MLSWSIVKIHLQSFTFSPSIKACFLGYYHSLLGLNLKWALRKYETNSSSEFSSFWSYLFSYKIFLIVATQMFTSHHLSQQTFYCTHPWNILPIMFYLSFHINVKKKWIRILQSPQGLKQLHNQFTVVPFSIFNLKTQKTRVRKLLFLMAFQLVLGIKLKLW